MSLALLIAKYFFTTDFRTIILLYVIGCIECVNDPLNKEKLKAHKFPPCAACKILINSFKKGIERTTREKFDGGDAAWEEDKLGKYGRSETRLTEIQEKLCTEIERGENQCHSLAAEVESRIEEWWFKYQDEYPDIYDYICIKELQRCCPKDHYGPQCTPCLGIPNNICTNNGKCKGAGTRKGDGTCACDRGYAGRLCAECASGYYESYKDENKVLCSQCHIACSDTCKGPGPKNCDKCNNGWHMLDNRGCVDIDECLKSDTSCPGNQFCVNSEGSYTCIDCDKACDGCTGDGPDMCIKCADGYHKQNNLCINSDFLGRKKHINIARYVTYLGLCVATCIIFQRNIYAASVIGLAVGIYISVSEYMIAHSDVQDTMADR
ncbi:hypothetical protein KM043_014383 [Ampulex compressa]|nr:hypothetical protein KM043_014383 [Ampulex compressa]